MATRLQHWDKIEKCAKELLSAMEAAARDPAWRDSDIERFDELYTSLTERPRLSILERGMLSGQPT